MERVLEPGVFRRRDSRSGLIEQRYLVALGIQYRERAPGAACDLGEDTRDARRDKRQPYVVTGAAARHDEQQHVSAERVQRPGYVDALAAGNCLHAGWPVDASPVHAFDLVSDIQRRVERND